MTRRLKILIAIFVLPVVLFSFIMTGTGEQIIAGTDVVFAAEDNSIENSQDVDLHNHVANEVPLPATPVE